MITYDQVQPHTWLGYSFDVSPRAEQQKVNTVKYCWPVSPECINNHPTHTWGLRWVLFSLLKASSNAFPGPSALRGSGLC